MKIRNNIGLSSLLVLMLSLVWIATVQAQLTATYNASDGLTSLTLNGQTVMTGRTADLHGHYYSLTGDVVDKDWNWSGSKPTGYFAPEMGKLVYYMGNKGYGSSMMLSGWPRLTIDEPGHFAIEQRYVNGAWITVDHVLLGNDLILTVIVDNQSDHYFQLSEWLAMKFPFSTTPTRVIRQETYYPATNVYSPVAGAWDGAWGVGVNYTKHNMRPFWIKLTNNTSNTNHQDLVCWMKNAPVPSGGRNKYTLVLRFDDTTPDDWRNLLEPYKTWFNGHFGAVAKYSVDFRTHVLTTCAADGLVTPSNPLGFVHPMDVMGWGTHLANRLSSVVGHNIGPIVFWNHTGIDPRGVNIRPDFDVVPDVLENDYDSLRTFMSQNGDRKFGFCTRPGTIAYRQNLDVDNAVITYPFNKSDVRMLDRRFEKMIVEGASAFYLDSYGSFYGTAPGSANAVVYYLKHLREKVGPHVILFSEMGFDALHVYAPIWPRSSDGLGFKPYGEFARWLLPGASEICRVFSDAGAERAWQGGAVPIAEDYLVVTSMINIQNQYVNSDGTSMVRTDCIAPVP